MKLRIEKKPGGSSDLEIPLREPSAGAAAWPARAGLSAAGNARSAYGGETLSSRAARELPDGSWKLRWKTAHSSHGVPRHVLADGGRILVQSDGWQVWDSAGAPLSKGQLGAGQVSLDSAKGLVYSIDLNGMLTASEIVGGKRRYMVLAKGGDAARFHLVLPDGDAFLLAGQQQPRGGFEQMDPARRDAPAGTPLATLQRIVVGAEPRVGASGLVLSPASTTLMFSVSRLVAAHNASMIVFAVPGGLFFADQSLQITRAYTIAGTPAVISVDETGRAYLLLVSPGRRELVVITPDGECVLSQNQAEAGEGQARPPVIGFDHTIFLTVGPRILAIGQAGRELWHYDSASGSAGMLVTPAGLLLSAEGFELAQYDPTGKRSVLFETNGERLCAAPVITSAGNLLVASEKYLHFLEAA